MESTYRPTILYNWRLIGGGADSLGILVGEVSDHPSLPDGWITTSAVSDVAEDCSWARTASRRYDLVMPLPNEERLPPKATEVVLSRLLRNAGSSPLTETDLKRLVAFAEELSEAPVKRNR